MYLIGDDSYTFIFIYLHSCIYYYSVIELQMKASSQNYGKQWIKKWEELLPD